VRAEDKPAALLWLVREVVPQQQLTLVFAATRHHVEFLHQLLTKEGVNAACVYGSMDQVGWLTGGWVWGPITGEKRVAASEGARGVGGKEIWAHTS
jgi:hypothetical protein